MRHERRLWPQRPLWGQAGRHARTTVGVSSLPDGVSVEIDLVLELAEGAG
jgi:enamine deaminase RidA (YjgF/YER057c/UK114 family)